MPRDLGDAEPEDLTGHLPGERDDLVSGLARYLRQSGQLRVAGDSEPPGNGRHETEIPVRASAAESLRAEASGAFADLTLDAEQDAEILIEPLLSPAPLEETGELSIEMVRAQLVPEMIGREPEFSEFSDEETDTAPPSRKRGLPTMKPEANELFSSDTGVLEMQAGALPNASDSEGIADDDTNEDERVTAKIVPGRGQPYRLSVPIVRDTVNFYNQTQALRGEEIPRRDKLPTISLDEAAKSPLADLEPADDDFADDDRGNQTDRFDDAVRQPPGRSAEKQKDTQKFYVSDVAESSAGESTAAELEMAQQGRPAAGAQEIGFETVGDITASDMEAARKAPLPAPSEVSADFELVPEETASQRLVPELTSSESAGFNSAFQDELPSVELEAEQELQDDGPARITERVTKPPAPQPQPKQEEAEAVPRITDALTRRIRQEREETLRLIQQAEEVAARLRAASERTQAAPQAKPAAQSAPRATAAQPPKPEPAVPPLAQPSTRAEPAARSHRVDSRRTTRRRHVVPPNDIVERIESKLSSRAFALDASVFAGSNRFVQPSGGYFARHDVDELVAASAVLRESIEEDWEDESWCDVPDDPPPQPAPPRRLSDRLHEIRDVLDSRPSRYLVEERSVRVAPVLEVPSPVGNQERLWKTLVGILFLMFGLGAAFSYGLFYFLQSR